MSVDRGSATGVLGSSGRAASVRAGVEGTSRRAWCAIVPARSPRWRARSPVPWLVMTPSAIAFGGVDAGWWGAGGVGNAAETCRRGWGTDGDGAGRRSRGRRLGPGCSHRGRRRRRPTFGPGRDPPRRDGDDHARGVRRRRGRRQAGRRRDGVPVVGCRRHRPGALDHGGCPPRASRVLARSESGRGAGHAQHPGPVGAGVSALAGGRRAGEADVGWAEEILGAVGTVVRLPEASLDAVTGLSGSGPAYIFLVVEALIDAGVARRAGPRGEPDPGLGDRSRGRPGCWSSRARAREPARPGHVPRGHDRGRRCPCSRTDGLRRAITEAVAAATERSRALSGG